MEPTANLPPDLTDEEINLICAPLKQSAAQIRFLSRVLGVSSKRKPNRRPLVSRQHYLEVRSGKTAETTPSSGPQPNWTK